MKIFINIYALVIGLVAAFEAFSIVLFFPAALYDNSEVLLIWGWFGTPLGFVAGILAMAGVVKWTQAWTGHALSAPSHRARKVASALIQISTIVGGVGYYLWSYDDVHVEWAEQVSMIDGAPITVQRGVSGNILGKSRVNPRNWSPKDYSIEISGLPTWNSGLRPVFLDKSPENGEWIIVAEPIGCGGWIRHGRPVPPYMQFVLRDKSWVSRPLEEYYIGRKPNLLMYPRFLGEEKLVSPELARSVNEIGPRDQLPVIHAKSKC